MDIRPGSANESQPQDFAAALRKEAYSSVLRMLSEQGVRQELLVYRGLPVTHLPEKNAKQKTAQAKRFRM